MLDPLVRCRDVAGQQARDVELTLDDVPHEVGDGPLGGGGRGPPLLRAHQPNPAVELAHRAAVDRLQIHAVTLRASGR